MDSPILELEGTAEEIQLRIADFAGQRLHVSVRQLDESNGASAKANKATMSIEEKIRARFDLVPPGERIRVPADLTSQLDH
ncbi:MAG: hypothetical protein ABJA67_06645 [Chthonomonadales bacterium]